ncbi:hypothetical protein V8J82_00510 [Gymnodinialimonas sp. 2305UL16-5]|uniref:hypothetical protein n=1 Tax=Gymnodinialimonas mytili TaxID=3126503 RepID=UPI0030A70CC5
MKLTFAAAAITLATAAMAQADGLDFNGQVSMGLGGTTQAGVTEIVPVTRFDGRATMTFDLDIGVEVGIVVPLQSDGDRTGAAITISSS